MILPTYEDSVFINCPFDEDFAPLLEAMTFCVVRAGLNPRLASESLEAGQSRLDKISDLIGNCKYSIHDLSMAKANVVGEEFRMNMPFELGMDMGRRRAPDEDTNDKKFLVFEKHPYELKRCLSDLAGTDVAFHRGDFQRVIQGTRDFFRVEAEATLPGPTKIADEYADFLGWMTEKKISEGHTEDEATKLPTSERISEMQNWMNAEMPSEFTP